MENEKKIKINLSKSNLFQGMATFSSLLILFGVFNLTKINQLDTNISRLETRIEREKVDIEDAKIQIEEIEKEFEGAPYSSPLDIEGRIPLIVRDIERLINHHNISPSITGKNSMRDGGLVASTDIETGLRIVSFNVSLNYNRYEDIKNMLIDLRDSFPITIDKVSLSNNNASLDFTIYGD